LAIDGPDERDPLDLLADEFAQRCRSGDRPSVADYAARHPEFADRIEQLFPAVGLMEQLRREESVAREAAMRRSSLSPPPEHLGDFDILQEIGRGGMGIVYEAEQRSLSRRVALKVLPKHALLCDKELRRFQREAQTAARLHHTNIVTVFGVGEQEGLHYYVMPLVRGIGLDEVIAELRRLSDGHVQDLGRVVQPLVARKFGAGPLPPGRKAGASRQQYQAAGGRWISCRAAAEIGLQAADALAHAHEHGTLHRDIKPGNLLIEEDGAVSVADFGLARAIDPADRSRGDDVAGTVRYMAPEQFLGRADVRSDLYALGLTLYELLTLRSPPVDRGRATEPIRPRKLRADIPRDLETILLKCLAPEPDHRYRSAAALAEDLRSFLEDRPIAARPACRVERLWRWRRRNPALAGVSALAAVLLVAVALTAVSGYMRTRTAYGEAKDALRRAEATSQVSLAVLEDIYLQLSPDRVWIASAGDAGDAACACIGLGTGEPASSLGGRIAVQVQASRETAALLEHLLVFYDRLAEQSSNDRRVKLQSAIASRRVGDIRQRLGQFDHAEQEYRRAVGKLAAMQSEADTAATIATELARCHNEIGNVRSARLDHPAALASHTEALSVLESFRQTAAMPAAFRYELARTLYLLSSKRPSIAEGLAGREPAGQAGIWPLYDADSQRREAAIRILEELVREDPQIPDFRFLLALCHRPTGIVPTPARGSEDGKGRRRAIRILEDLKSQYPGVADYRYELTATYAWVPVGLFPWQGQFAAAPDVEQSLRKAFDESQWLVTHNPTIPHYATSQALILAKLGAVAWTARRLGEAEAFFQQALDRQSACVEEFPDLPPHNRVLIEFFRLRLAQVHYEGNPAAHDSEAMQRCRTLLGESIEGLTELGEKRELSEDRLLRTSLTAARQTLGRLRAKQSGNSVGG